MIEATPEDVERAVGAAAEMSGTAPFRLTDRLARADLLDALADALADQRHRLVPLADSETSLGPARLYGEILRTVYQLEMCASLLRDGAFLRATIDTSIDLPPPYGRPDLRRINHAVGPVAVFAASNFPFAFSVLGNDTASAMAAGCPVVLKAHPGHPETSNSVFALAQQVLRDHGIAPGALSLLQGTGYEANLALVADPRIQAVGFTGSTHGGRALLDTINARPQPIPFFGELGAVNPVIVLPGAAGERGEALGPLLAGGAAMGMGQFCTNPGVIFVPESAVGQALITSFLTALDGAPCHPLLNDRIDAGFAAALARLTDSGAILLRDGAGSPRGPSVFQTNATAFAATPALREEAFGPATLIVTYANRLGLMAAVDALEGSLTASLHSTDADAEEVAALIPKLSAISGRLLFGGVPPGVALADAMVHGGPWPSSTRPDTSSVGALSVMRWLRPVCYQSAPGHLLPVELDDANATGIPRRVNGRLTTGPVAAHSAGHFAPRRNLDTWTSPDALPD